MEVTWIAILASLCMIRITLSILGILNPILAPGAMLLSSVSVVVNSLRLTKPSADQPSSMLV